MKGGGKEEQGPKQKKSKKGEKTKTAVVAVSEEKDELFAFVCTSAYANIAKLSRSQNPGWVPVLTVELAGITALIAQSSPTINRSTVT